MEEKEAKEILNLKITVEQELEDKKIEADAAKTQADMLKAKKDAVFGPSKVEADDGVAKVIEPKTLSKAEMKKDKEEKAESDKEAETAVVEEKKAKADKLEKSEEACPSEKKEARESADKAEKEANEKEVTEKLEKKQEAAQEAYEKKVAGEEAKVKKAAKAEEEKEEVKAKVDAAAYQAENAAAKVPRDKRGLSSDEKWAVADLGGNLNLA